MRKKSVLSYLKSICLLALGLNIGCSTTETKNENIQKKETLFELVHSDNSGITFSNKVVEKYDNFFEFFMYVYNGGGVATGDINGDGLPDIYFNGNEIPNKLYLNKGNLQFEDITASAGVAGDEKWDNGVSMIDINNDGLQDIYVCRGGWQDQPEDRRNLLYVNQGDLTFKEEAAKYGLDDTGYSMQATFFDFDNDNDLDMYLMNRPDSFALPITKVAQLRKDPPEASRDKFYVNNGGKFTEEGKERGFGQSYGYGLSAVAADINGDQFIDLFISNDFSGEDYFYRNQGDGTFIQDIKNITNHIALYSMGTDITDINNDGLEDIVVMEMRPSDYVRSKVSMPSMDVESFYNIMEQGMHKQFMHNMLYLNQGHSFFSEVSQYAGMSKTDWSWSVLSSDLDQDGFRDLFITNGMRRDLFDGDVKMRMQQYVEDNKNTFKSGEEALDKGFTGIINTYRPIKIQNYLMKNSGQLTYDDVSSDWGFDVTSFSNGAAVADLDNDGDLDLLVNNFEDAAFLYENTGKGNGHSVTLDLDGPADNIDGLGAKVTITHDGKKQYFQNKTVRGYLSSSDPRVHFGLGKSQLIDSILVQWTDGKTTLLTNQKANEIVKVSYEESVNSVAPKKTSELMFTAESQLLTQPYTHRENYFNEYKKQVLLPHMFSKNGPFIATGDLNGDQKQDFYIGGAAGQAGQIYVQQNGKFVPKSTRLFLQDKEYEDMGATFADIDADGDLDLVVVSGGSEFPEGHPLYQDRIYYNDGRGNFNKKVLLPSINSGSCVAPNDIDGDGDLDLFIGGQVVADQYIAAPNSYLYINENGTFVDKTAELSKAISKAGMVNAAAWADLNSDQNKELILVGEWMPIQVYEYKNGTFNEISESLGLSKTEGWWQTITASDLDQDGDMDLILGNQGENYKFSASEKKPFEVFVSDFDKNGTNDVFLAKQNKNKTVPIRGRECTSDQMPVIAKKFPTFTSFAYADLSQIIGSEIENAVHKEVYQFSSIILENDNGQLKVRKLPKEAQFSAIQGIRVKDFDEDGILDLLIAGNKFDSEIETTPADASPGYLLKGKGNLEFEAVHPSKSGLMIPFNVKDIELIDVNGKTKALVAVNDGELRVVSVK